MKLNYGRSKTINRKTTTNCHLPAEDPPVIICRHISIEDESHRLPVYNCTLKICLTLPIGLLVWLFIFENRKIGFPLEMDFCLRCQLTCHCNSDGVTLIIKCMVIAALSVKHHTNIRAFPFSGKAIARKMLS